MLTLTCTYFVYDYTLMLTLTCTYFVYDYTFILCMIIRGEKQTDKPRKPEKE